jgi:hypothetical protein
VSAKVWFRSTGLCLAGLLLPASVPAQAVDRPVLSGPREISSVDYHFDGYRPKVDYRVDGYRPRPVPPEKLPDYQNYVTPLEGTQPVDAQGVALTPLNGRKVYHPLVIARYGVVLLHSYRITHDPAFVDRAEVNAAFLINTAVSRDGALYFPYRFKYALFGNPSDLMDPPWYSVMAQGAALTLFERLFAVTGEERWRTAADSTFATFVQRRRARRPWTVFVARNNGRKYLWLEEYAKNPPTQVLNGFLYALVGVWEYARASRDASALHVFDGAATTIRHQVQRFRVPGGVSYYSLRVHAQYRDYHCVHVWQLKLLTRMTGDPWFAREGRRFATDAPRASVGC